MRTYTFKFEVTISKTSAIEGVYTVLGDNFVTAANDLAAYLQYGFGKSVHYVIDLVSEAA